MKIAIIGAGALGMLFGGLLARADHDVQLVHHRSEYVRALEDEGVRVESQSLPDGSFHVPVSATTDAREIAPVDVALVLVKAQDTREALEQHRACIGPETRVLTLQNGLRCYETVCDVVGADRAVGGVTYQNASRTAPGVVNHTGTGPTAFGGEDDTFARTLRERFLDAGIEDVSVVDDPHVSIWDKQLIGVAIKPVAALTRLSNAEIIEDDRLTAAMKRMMLEAEAVAASRDIDVSAEARFEELVEFLEETDSDHRSSMLQDVAAERPTEIDEINAAIVDLADAAGIDVPYNRFATALVCGLERSYLRS